ncbi:MAG: hypothetical protein ACRYGI_11380 [Janthinobacterium lividum]
MYARTATRAKPRKSQIKKWPAPVAGWIANRSLSEPATDGATAVPPGAAVMDNFFPRSSNVVLRRGSLTVANLPTGDVTALFRYDDGSVDRFFASTASTIYDISDVPDPTQPNAGPAISGTVVSSGYTGGEWIITQFATTGGVYLVGVNGKDAGFVYDGATFTSMAGITFPNGYTSADMVYVWAYKNRLFFARVDSMDSYYLPVDAIAGAADVFPLSGVFTEGGELLFGASWSLQDSGNDGLSEQMVYVSSEGQVAVYQGDDPSNAATWSKVGLYRVGAPLGRQAFFRGGGDIAVATTVGLVPLSKAVTLDQAALNAGSVSYKITDAWTDAVNHGLFGWKCLVWPEGKMAIVAPNDANKRPIVFVTNAETGAWARFTGWTVTALAVFGGNLYFGSTDGKVIRAQVTGSDDGTPYTGVLLPLFDDLGNPASTKIVTVGRARVMANLKIEGYVTTAVEFNVDPPPQPDATASLVVSDWDYGKWGTSVWSSQKPSVINQDWQSLGSGGYSLSMWYQITSGDPIPLDAEVIGMDMLFEVTEAIG